MNKRVEPTPRTRASPTCSTAHAQREWHRLWLMHEPLVASSREISIFLFVLSFVLSQCSLRSIPINPFEPNPLGSF